MLHALALNCTLKPSPAESSCDLLLREIITTFAHHGVGTEQIRLVDYDIKPGVTRDEGSGDDWPELRTRILAADILILGTPIWLGNVSSVCQRVLERMDAFLPEEDEQDRKITYGRVAAMAAVDSEGGGTHQALGQMSKALNDVGFTLPANASVSWSGEAKGKVNVTVPSTLPSHVTDTTDKMVRNAVHMIRLLQGSEYPGE